MANTLVRIHPLEGRVFGGNGVSLVPLEACERIYLLPRQGFLPSGLAPMSGF